MNGEYFQSRRFFFLLFPFFFFYVWELIGNNEHFQRTFEHIISQLSIKSQTRTLQSLNLHFRKRPSHTVEVDRRKRNQKLIKLYHFEMNFFRANLNTMNAHFSMLTDDNMMIIIHRIAQNSNRQSFCFWNSCSSIK